MPQFPILTQNIQNNQVVISDKKLIRHISLVLRLKINDELLLIDEAQKVYTTVITSISRDEITAKIEHVEISNKKLNFTLDLLQCTLKSGAMDMVVQKMTELGTKNLYVMPSYRSVSKFNDKEVKSKLEKWQKIADESCKQCERGDRPNIFYMPSLEKLKEHASQYDLVIACVERSSQRTLKDVLRNAFKHERILVIIGPEGGFEDKEIQFFKDNHFETVSISNLIYRAETAAIAALSGVIYEYEL